MNFTYGQGTSMTLSTVDKIVLGIVALAIILIAINVTPALVGLIHSMVV